MSLRPFDITRADSDFKDHYEQLGYVIPVVYSGVKYKKGHRLGNILSSVLQKALPLVKKGALSLVKTALQAGLNIARDGLEGKDIKTSFQNNMRAAGRDILKEGVTKIATSIQTPNKKRKRKAPLLKRSTLA